MKVQNPVYEMTDMELRLHKRRLRQKREFRRKCLMLFMTFCLIMVGTVSYYSFHASANTGEKLRFKYYTSITVSYGDTLWDIADQYIDYENYEDKNEYVAEVRNINHLDVDANIKAGQYLIVPYYSNDYIE